MTEITRRSFLKAGMASSAALLAMNGMQTAPVYGKIDMETKPKILGGEGVHCDAGPSWPIPNDNELKRLTEVFEKRLWNRSDDPACAVSEFEKFFADLMGVKHCVAVSSGTAALTAALAALETGPGDEIITTPYSYVATVNSILLHYALPVLADVDINSFQVCPKCAGRLINSRTKALMPVHIAGAPAKLDGFVDAAQKNGGLPVIEDACQAHLGKWQGKQLGSIGTMGCFSMQITKNLSCGEGGAVITDDDELAERLQLIHTHGQMPQFTGDGATYLPLRASNFRMTGFQAAVLLGQKDLLEERARIRNENALYLSSLLADIPGIYPIKIYDGGLSAWHLYAFRVVKEEFGCDRDTFYKALDTDGIPTFTGYGDGDWIRYIRTIYSTPAARRIYSEQDLNDWEAKINLPNHNKLCREAIWLQQYQLLAPRENMEIIADAIRRIQRHAGEIQKLDMSTFQKRMIP